MRFNRTLTAGITIAALGLTACSDSEGETSESDDDVTLRVATPFGPESRHTIAMQQFADGVTERTNGSLDFDFYYQDALVSPPEAAEALQAGTVDLSFTMMALSPDVFTIDSWIARAASSGDSSPDAGTLQKAAAILDWAAKDEDYIRELEDNGVYPLVPRLLVFDTYGVYCDSPVTSLDDASGQRVRVGGNAWSEEARALGMVPVSLPSTETYTSLQQGVIDCFMGGLDDVDNLGLADLGGHYTAAGITGYDSISVLVSDLTWQQLSDDQRQAMQEEAGTYLENVYDGHRESVFEFIKEIEEAGDVTLHTPDADLSQAVEDYQNETLANLAENAPDAVTDPQQTLDDYAANLDSWMEIAESAGHSSEDASWAEFYGRVDGEPDSVSDWAETVRERVLDDYYAADQ